MVLHDEDEDNILSLAKRASTSAFCKSKRFIEKVMLLESAASPRWDTSHKQNFDGKIGIWSFVTREPAKRSRKNRGKGVLLSNSVNVTREQYYDFVFNKVLPAIKQK